jgi:hypothetical protein
MRRRLIGDLLRIVLAGVVRGWAPRVGGWVLLVFVVRQNYCELSASSLVCQRNFNLIGVLPVLIARMRPDMFLLRALSIAFCTSVVVAAPADRQSKQSPGDVTSSLLE